MLNGKLRKLGLRDPELGESDVRAAYATGTGAARRTRPDAVRRCRCRRGPVVNGGDASNKRERSTL